MGTNYYTKTKECKECGHKPEGVHLGKSSAGWQFSFQYNGGQYYKSVEEMREWLKDKTIVNEYGEEMTQEDFWLLVESKSKGLNHVLETNDPRSFIKNGYVFVDCEFS